MSVITGGIVVIVVSVLIYKCYKLRMMRKYGGLPQPAVLPTVEMRTAAAAPTVVGGGSTATMASGTISSSYGAIDVVKNRPVRFSSLQLQEFTGNYAEKLGAGGFGVVFRGQIPLPDHGSLPVAVKVLGSNMGRRAEEQFMAEIGTIGRTSHVNLVRLYGFCFDADLKALVYEFMPNGSLDRHLFHGDSGGRQLVFDKLYDVAVGTAKAIRYLHDDCERRIIHYDIKPGNVLLTADYTPKVADFGLARLCNRDNTHLTMTGARGTPGYAAPELWLPLPVTHKCDVYSFGMLVLEILGRRRNLEPQHPAVSQEWYPRWVWQRFDQGRFDDVMAASGIQAKDRDKAERMCKVAFWCVQQQPEARPPMGAVVKMLEGEMDIAPPINPFQHLMAAPGVGVNPWMTTTTTGSATVNTQTVWANRVSKGSNEIISIY